MNGRYILEEYGILWFHFYDSMAILFGIADTDCTILNTRPISVNPCLLMDCGWIECHNPKIGHCGIKLFMTALKVGIFNMQT